MRDERKLVTRTPENSETPIESVRSWVTPNRLFFVRNHFSVPSIDVHSWRLTLTGLVARTAQFTYDDLSRMPVRTVFATVECAGNGRSFLSEKAAGVQWGAGAIGHAEWTGVSVREVLQQAGVQSETTEILFEGADAGREGDHPELMHFERSLPLSKAMHPDTLLALRMNGEPLDPEHGFPVRLFVPGWYGVCSVKWLTRVTAIQGNFRGYFQSKKYTYRQATGAGLKTVVIGPMQVKSEIIRPRPGDSLGIGTNRVFGVAWAGEQPVASVEVSTNGGQTWNPADLVGPQSSYSWTMWEYPWEVDAPGEYSLISRATAQNGMVQPQQYDPLYGGYMIHHLQARLIRVQDMHSTESPVGDPQTYLYDMNAFAEDNQRLPLDAHMEFNIGGGI